MSKRESSLKSAFFQELKRQLPDYRVLQYSTAGAPDRSIVGDGFQSNWEFKHATPGFVSHDNQELLCMRLAKAGHCRYVLWIEFKGVQQTRIVHPTVIHQHEDYVGEACCAGFNHRWLVDYIQQVHTR